MGNTTAQEKSNSIPLGRRIGEIMEEKGDAFSIRAFANRIGISKDILSRCINGDRYIKPSELEKIAKGLNMTIERIREDDTREVQKELQHLLETIKNPKRSIDIATDLANLAVGVTEKSKAFNQLGRALFISQKYDKAHHAWLQAYDTAHLVAKRYGENDVLYHVLANLMISYAHRKEFSRMEEIVEQVEPLFHHNPSRMGAICYSVAMAAYDRNELDIAREKLYESLEHYLKTSDNKSIGVAQRNVAYIEYKFRNFQRASGFFEEAIKNLEQDAYWQLVAIKDNVKNLIMLKELDVAEQHITSAVQKLEKMEFADLKAKFQLLLGRAKNDVTYAEEIIQQSKAGKNVLKLACKFILNYFSRVGDAESLLKYYRRAEGMLINHCDILEDDAL